VTRSLTGPRLSVRRLGLVLVRLGAGETSPSCTALSSARPPVMGMIRATATPRSVTTTSSPSRTRARKSLRRPRSSRIPTSIAGVYTSLRCLRTQP
jgi:hypothetical protein